MSKGDAEHAAEHQHGIVVKESGTVDAPVTNERIIALEARLAKLESRFSGGRRPAA